MSLPLASKLDRRRLRPRRLARPAGCRLRTAEVRFLPVDPGLSVSGGRMIEKVNLAEKFASLEDYWSPRIAGELNDAHVKLVRLKGEFIWHHHEQEDELFLVVKGRLLMRLRDGDVWLDEGELIIIPRGVEHLPVAPEEAHVLLFEPRTTLNTGNVRDERTVEARPL
jgi:mannose-6-phosphate isomerase-like protein (cupin superfamily)